MQELEIKKLSEEEINRLQNKKSNMIKTLVLLEENLKKEAITKNFFLRLKSGIDFIIADCVKKLKQQENKSLITSELSFNKIANISQISKIDKNDLKIFPLIQLEVELLEKFEKHIEEQNNFTAEDFTKLLKSQQKLDKKIFNKEN